MPRFFFHVVRNNKMLFDPDGVNLASAARAHGEAVERLAAIASEEVVVTTVLEVTIVVTDVSENILYRAYLDRVPSSMTEIFGLDLS